MIGIITIILNVDVINVSEKELEEVGEIEETEDVILDADVERFTKKA